ncbi:MAG: ribokinase [Patescibacteria group bacterium]|nr:ribokinase [Patescibacteria group bacterium]
MKNIKFLAIGDIVTDAFIQLQDARVSCDIDDDNCTISMRFGDKIPYKDVEIVKAVGNSPNAAVSASRLGLKTALITYVGNDENGKECIETLKENGVLTNLVQTQDGFKTNYHYVLSFEAERTILIKHANFNYDFKSVIEKIEPPEWIYLSSLAENSIKFQHDIAKYVKEKGVKLAFQPGTFQISLGSETLKDIYESSYVFFCNKEEAQRILKNQEKDIKKLLQGIHDLGPKIAVITDGPDGAYTYDGRDMLYLPMYPDPKPPVERTGAGDSFSSTFTTALALGMPVEQALMWGPVNSMSVVQYVGAQKGLLSRAKLEEWLSKAPSYYKPKKIN